MWAENSSQKEWKDWYFYCCYRLYGNWETSALQLILFINEVEVLFSLTDLTLTFCQHSFDFEFLDKMENWQAVTFFTFSKSFYPKHRAVHSDLLSIHTCSGNQTIDLGVDGAIRSIPVKLGSKSTFLHLANQKNSEILTLINKQLDKVLHNYNSLNFKSWSNQEQTKVENQLHFKTISSIK